MILTWANDLLSINGEINEDEGHTGQRSETCSKMVTPVFSGIIVSAIFDWIKDKLEQVIFLSRAVRLDRANFTNQVEWICKLTRGPAVALELMSRIRLNIKQYVILEELFHMAFEWLSSLCQIIAAVFLKPDGTFWQAQNDEMSPLVELVENIMQRLVKNIYDLFPFVQQLETEALKELMAKQQTLKSKRKSVTFSNKNVRKLFEMFLI